MRTLLIILLAFAAVTTRAEVVVRTSVSPESGAVVGQRVRLAVDVLFPGTMPRPPLIVAPEVAGAQVLRLETQGTNISESINGESFVGQQFEFSVYPRRAGEITVPPVEVRLRDVAGNEAGTVQAPETRFSVKLPDGLDASRPVVATTEFTVEEHWVADPSGTGFKAGDAVKRTIEFSAADVSGMAIPVAEFTAPEGVRIYRAEPSVKDELARGDVTGHRSELVTYVFEKPGRFTLAELKFEWWDLSARAVREVVLPARTFEIAPNPTAESPAEFEAKKENRWVAILLAAVGVLAFWQMWRRFGDRIRESLKAWQHRRSESERACFRRLQSACRTGDTRDTYRALMAWSVRADVSPRRDIGDVEFDALSRAVFTNKGNWTREQGIRLERGVAVFRKLRAKNRSGVPDSHLPALNPCFSESRRPIGIDNV